MQSQGHGTYQPVHRISRACLDCRRKKTRCSGERPSCRKCRKHHRTCSYPVEPTHQKDPTSDNTLESLHTTVGMLASKLSRVEQMLENIQQTLQDRPLAPKQPVASALIDDSVVLAEQRKDCNQPDTPSVASVAEAATDDETLWLTVPSPVISNTLDLFFKYCHNQPYSMFHEARLRQRLAQGLLPRYLIFAILASAARYSDNPFYGHRSFEMSVFYARKSWSSIVATCFAADKPADLTIVQTVTLLSIFDFTAGKTRHGAAWVKIGLAVRLAQDLRLMLEDPAPISNEEKEERRRVFWSIYILDRLVTCGRARPPAIVDTSCTLQLPLDETAWKNGENYSTPTIEAFTRRTIPSGSEVGPFALTMLMAHILSKVSQHTLQQSNFRSQYRPWDVNSEQASIEADLLHLESLQMRTWTTQQLLQRYQSMDGQIDQHSAAAAVFSRTLFHLSHCMLYHPFLFRSRMQGLESTIPPSFLARTFDAGWNHAKLMIEHILEARKAGIVAHTSFYSYCAAVACSTLGLNMHLESGWKRDPSANLLEQAISFVEDLSRYWKNAASLATILKTFMSRLPTFPHIASDNTSVEDLEAMDNELMWTLLDYSTISRSSHGHSSWATGSTTSSAVDNSWSDLFIDFNVVETDDNWLFDHPTSVYSYPQDLVSSTMTC